MVLSNVVSYLTGCPTREKIGWLEQTYLNADAMLLNIDAPDCYCGVKGAAVSPVTGPRKLDAGV